MKESAYRWAFCAACAVYVALVWAVDIWGLRFVWNAISGQTAAAWVQAAGSIAAIGGTAAVMLWQHQLQVSTERRGRLNGEIVRLEGTAKLFQHAEVQAAILVDVISEPDGWDKYAKDFYPHEDYGSVQETLRAIKVDDISDPALLREFFAGRAAYEEFVRIVKEHHGGRDVPQARGDELGKQMKELRARLHTAENSFGLHSRWLREISR